MSRILFLFSSELERDAAFPVGVPDGALTAITGVGLIDAAIATANAVRDTNADAVVYLGTCGAHRESRIPIGAIVVAESVCISSGDVARGEMRMPSLLATRVDCDVQLGMRVARRADDGRGAIARARVSCTLGVTENDVLAGLLSSTSGCEVENLEAFSVMRAASPRPTAIVLGVTNIVGANGGRDWHANHAPMMQRLARCVVSESPDDITTTIREQRV